MKLKTRENEPKKVLIYGLDGSGKSTFAEKYCKDNNLNPIVIDVDNTNYTDCNIVDIDLSTDIKAYQNMKDVIKEIVVSDYDTIIIDGVSSLIELFTSKAKGMKAYKDRADRFNSVLRKLINSKKNLIFIGQADMEVIYNEDHQSNKPVIKTNSIVNEKYRTYIDSKGHFSSKTEKFRGEGSNGEN